MEHTLTAKISTRPDDINTLLEGLERYDVSHLATFQNYVATQCKDGTFDIEANLALLKLYQFNIDIQRDDDTVLNILVKGLVRFWSSDFMLAFHLLPPYVGEVVKLKNDEDGFLDQFSENAHKLLELYKLLDGSKYSEFWTLFESDDAYADLVADVVDFKDAIRKSIAQTIQISARAISVKVLEDWVNLTGSDFETWITKELGFGWEIDTKSGIVTIPANKENESKPVVSSETLHFDQLGYLIKRAYEGK